MPATNSPKPKAKPRCAAARGVSARHHKANNTARAATGIGKIPNGAKPATQDNPASNAQPFSLLNKLMQPPDRLQNPRSITDSWHQSPIRRTTNSRVRQNVAGYVTGCRIKYPELYY